MDPSSPETPRRNSDIDFNDVFGGPPLRPSIQETRYGFDENRRIDEPAVAASARNPWSGLSEKPVFGEEEMARRRRSKSDFFYDIFRGKESSSTSRKYEMKDPFAPGSQLMGPGRPLPPKPEPFGSSSPAHFRHPSLPAKLNIGMDLPTSSSSPQTTLKSKGGSSNGLSYYFSSPMSKFSGQANQDKEEPRNGFQSWYCFSKGNEESTNLTKYVETERKGNSNEDSSSSEISKNGSRFHFSIYKWANKGGVPVANPLRGSDRRKEKDKLQRSSSANGWIAHESIAKEPKDKPHNRFYSFNGRSSNCKSFRVEHDKNENADSLLNSINDGELSRIIEEDNITKSESEIIDELKSTVKNVSKGEVSAVGNVTHKPQPKPTNLLFDNDDERGNGEITKNSGSKDILEMNAKKLSEILDGKNSKKQDVKKTDTSNVETSATSVKHSPRKSWDNGKARVREKVKELINIFNQDASSRPRTGAALSENHGSSRKEKDEVNPETEPNISMNKRVEKIQLNGVIKKKSNSDIPVANDMCNGASEKKLNSSIKDTVSDDSKTIVEDPAELFEDGFLVEDLAPEENNLPQFGSDPEEIKAIDDKIQRWSNGKQGNIRSLLSTLQYVLWPGSGWKPVPLVDIIEGPAVKRSYQKALLCLHPDKLQQKGAASDQKYIAQQVFDILQDAWTHFNSLASV
ncbi:hypothetical protein V6N13_143977 [Hibiscus sabdariffa]|uniref:J domain-containing protein required for chloroplast accumulation response 1 n=1 Tax=Hibiscus sabdariffa TaxID=183260 RepID=A0ABR2FJ05_9ROSI